MKFRFGEHHEVFEYNPLVSEDFRKHCGNNSQCDVYGIICIEISLQYLQKHQHPILNQSKLSPYNIWFILNPWQLEFKKIQHNCIDAHNLKHQLYH